MFYRASKYIFVGDRLGLARLGRLGLESRVKIEGNLRSDYTLGWHWLCLGPADAPAGPMALPMALLATLGAVYGPIGNPVGPIARWRAALVRTAPRQSAPGAMVGQVCALGAVPGGLSALGAIPCYFQCAWRHFGA